jgi:hypothetical protein
MLKAKDSFPHIKELLEKEQKERQEAKAGFDQIQTLKGELRGDPPPELARLLGNLNSFREDMPYAEMLKAKESFPHIKELLEAEKQRQQWQRQGLCTYCGGELKGFFKKTCKKCGKVNKPE